MTETKGMKSQSKSFGVFEFTDEPMLTEWEDKKIVPDFGCPQALSAESHAEKTPEKELEERLTAAGKSLSQPPSSLDELLWLLDRVEGLLSKVEQSSPKSMQTALTPLMKALVTEMLLKHSDIDVKVGVASCISEITRITSPDPPYDDDKMKDVFQLIVSSFEDLSDVSSRSHEKRATILETMAKVNSCLIILDLECDQMIVDMFLHFLKAIRAYHAKNIFASMETIMILVIEESEDISADLLAPILATLRKNKQDVMPIARKLAERVIQNSADKLRPYLRQAVTSLETSLDDYSEVVASACQENNDTVGHSIDSILKNQQDDERERIVFYADYLNYRGTKYMDSVVSFCRSYVEARIIYGDEETFHIHMEIDDIVKIESQWCAQFEVGMINIYFMAKDPAEAEFDVIPNVLGLLVQESNWYQKREAIELLNIGYKALWNVLFETGADSSLREREDWMLSRSYFPKFDRPFKVVIYPKGDPDAVSISKRDVDLLQPDTFVNDTIIDFYIKFLKTRQNVDTRTKFHFFNCFFFQKLAGMDKDPSSAYDGKAAFQRVRKWTKNVNLLEKDFIVIPVKHRLHWSLIIICYFGEAARYKDGDGDGDGESERVPCILHMDSLRGTHSGLKDPMQSYLWEEWKERQKGRCEDGLYSKFKNLKFVSLELPQQQNSYDCGLFLLHYLELFLEEVPADFSIYKITSSSKFLQEDWFPPAEPSIKRTHIEKLVSDLLDSDETNAEPSHRRNNLPSIPLRQLPTPKRICTSPLKTSDNIKKRRKVRRWSPQEEDALRARVKQFGKGQWKEILNSHRDEFVGRTGVDLKDKWRNMMRY